MPYGNYVHVRVYETNIRMGGNLKPEDHWSFIAHLSAEDMLKSVVIEEKKFKHSHWVGAESIKAKILMSTGRPHHCGHLLQV